MEKYALLSVYHKEGIVEFARELLELGWKLIASGGTARVLSAEGLEVQDVASLVGGKEILGHRVVTLSREIHAGLMARSTQEDVEELASLGIPRIDLVCVDLYPLQEAIRDPDADRTAVIEKTDIGGPALLRSGAKGRRIVICDPADRNGVIAWLKEDRPDEDEFVTRLVAKAEMVCARYSLLSANFQSQGKVQGIIGQHVMACKYGENPIQTPAGLYTCDTDNPLALDKFKLVKAGTPGYVNLTDVDRSLWTIMLIAAAFEKNTGSIPCIAIAVKHGNACGAAISPDPLTAVKRMIEGNTQDIMGGVVMVNFALNEELANALRWHKQEGDKKRNLDVVVAPQFSNEAIKTLARPKKRCIRLANPALANIGLDSLVRTMISRPVIGGFLLQPCSPYVLDLNDPEMRVVGKADDKLHTGLLLAWAVGATSDSNSITLVHPDGYLIGNGTGQKSRVQAVKLAIDIALATGHSCVDSILYTDSFFPFTDGPMEAMQGGVGTILLPTGSINDDEVLRYCEERGITVYALSHKKIRGFCWH